jgi:Serine hydroxymethyltransferase
MNVVSPAHLPDTPLIDFDPEVDELIGRELERQHDGPAVLASENDAPIAVVEAQRSVLTNCPGRRRHRAAGDRPEQGACSMRRSPTATAIGRWI